MLPLVQFKDSLEQITTENAFVNHAVPRKNYNILDVIVIIIISMPSGNTVYKFCSRRQPPCPHWWKRWIEFLRATGTFLRNHARELVPIEIFPRPIKSFRSLITRIAGAVKRRLTGLFRNLLSLPANSAGRIVDEPVSCQSIHRLRHQTVIAPVGFAGRGPPIER